MKVPEITINEWLKAEETFKASRMEPQPKGYITVENYASMKGCGIAHANRTLSTLWKAGIADRIQWSRCFVYKLKKL